ncbi:MAG: aspartate ammonia-lyase [Acidobacteriota bacterium]
MDKTRTEKDSIGTKAVPSDAYYGIQTARALENFPVSGIREHPAFIRSYVMVKKAAAETNLELGVLDQSIAGPVIQACDEILAGRFLDQFVVDVYQAGAGTSFNMNVNEVLANRALEILGKPRGDYKAVNPNDHVNMAQSTNDTFPTAMRVAGLVLLQELFPAVETLRDELEVKGRQFATVIKSGRTHLQDAVPITLGQEFAAYAAAIERALRVLRRDSEELSHLPIGGTAVGTGMNMPPGYRWKVCERLTRYTGVQFHAAGDPRELTQSNYAVAAASSALKNLALELTRLANDLRLLASGPFTGFDEINLPAVQPGSSIMPGKVNPVMAECLNMVAFQVIGNDLTISLAVQAGQLELNVMMPVMVYNLLHSIEILKNYLPVFVDKCIRGLTANEERCHYYFEHSPSLVTAINTIIGYSNAAEIAKESVKTGKTIRELIREKKILTDEQIEKIFNPEFMTQQAEKRTKD